MKETIYTIPVNDAYAEEAACPLCSLQGRLNGQLVAYYLGPALMEPDVRKTTNASGFCGQHLADLYQTEDNRLGLGLTLHTHLADLIGDIMPGLEQAVPVSRQGLFKGRDKDYRDKIREAADSIADRQSQCTICDRLEQTMDRYLDVIFHQYFADPAFQDTFNHGPGYCLPHLTMLLNGAARYLKQNQAVEFIQQLARLQRKCLESLRDDVEWYTLKFDYRNQDKSWKNSKDALPRAIKRLAGDCDLKKGQ